MQLCLFGRDCTSKKPMSQAEELDFGWAVFNHAGHPKEFMVLGSNEERYHTGITKTYGTISKYFRGGIFNPSRWNPFINDCWVLTGIKAEIDFQFRILCEVYYPVLSLIHV